MLNSLYPKSETRYTADHTFKFFTQKILHVFDLLVLIGCTFSFHSGPLSFTAMLALLFHFFVNTNRIFNGLLQHAVQAGCQLDARVAVRDAIVDASQDGPVVVGARIHLAPT